MNSHENFPEWDDFNKKEKVVAAIGWAIIAGTGVVIYQLGKRAGVNSVSE